MAFIKQGSPSTIIKVTEVVEEGKEKVIKTVASRPEKPTVEKDEPKNE
jgi:hypothetical protein